MNNTLKNALKPCPFCGGEANVIEHRFHGLDSSYGLQCKKCKAETYQFYESEEKAIEAWNRRAGEERRVSMSDLIYRLEMEVKEDESIKLI